MKKKALMYASVASMIQQFNMDNIRLLQELGYEVDVACNMKQGSTITDEKVSLMKSELETMGVHVYHIPVPRSITNIKDIWKSFWITRKLINEQEYSLIHCHSPIGGMICRLANRLSKWYGQVRMIYTAHGFHFYDGAPFINWLVFYPMENLCSAFTDVLITSNLEDNALAKRRMKAGRVVWVPGVGVDVNRISKVIGKRMSLCKELGVDENQILMLSVGELNDNKNHSAVVEVLNQLPQNYHYLICGQGANFGKLITLAKNSGCENRLHLLGYREDIFEIMKSCDLFVFPSKREGLSLSIMEAMACGLPCFVSDIRGNRDLIKDKIGGRLMPVGTFGPSFVQSILEITNLDSFAKKCSTYNQAQVDSLSKQNIGEEMKKIYEGKESNDESVDDICNHGCI